MKQFYSYMGITSIQRFYLRPLYYISQEKSTVIRRLREKRRKNAHIYKTDG